MKKIISASRKTAKTAGALARKKAAEPTITRGAFRGLQDSNYDVPVAPHAALKLQKESFGWPIYLANTPQGPVVVAGCRWFGFERALEHWTMQAQQPSCRYCGRGKGCNADRARGRKMVALLPLLAQRAKRYGWSKARA